jgi:predicted ATPase
VRTLAAPDPDDGEESARLERLGDWLHDETGGQPFFLTETLSALAEQGVLFRGGGARDATDPAVAVLPGVREAIVMRLARLGTDARLLLAAAAVVGRHADFDLLRHVVQLSEDAGLAALEEALATGLLHEVAEDAYACAHDTIRDVV